MKEIIYIFLGGGAGSVLRFLVSVGWKNFAAPQSQPVSFPWGTFVANVVGCFLISLFYQCSARWGWSAETRLLLTTGLCGGFTTFSTFGYEGLTLLRSGLYGTFVLYFGASLLFGLLAALIPLKLLS